MSSDAFDLRVDEVSGPVVRVTVWPTSAGGRNDMAYTRSFVLDALYGLLRDVARKSSPLVAAVDSLGGPTPDEAWYRKNVATFVERADVVEQGRKVREDGPPPDESKRFWFRVEATFTDAKYLAGVKKGATWGTTAFDWWWNDPTRWQPGRRPAKKTAAKKTATKKSAKPAAKAGTKKTAAATKKTAAKKTATKKAPSKKTAAKRG